MERVKTFKKLKKLEKEYTETFSSLYKKLKKELKNENQKIRIDMLKTISLDFDLDFSELYQKYISEKKPDIQLFSEKKIETYPIEELILDKVNIDDKEYYLDLENNVYSLSGEMIGEMKDNKIKFT